MEQQLKPICKECGRRPEEIDEYIGQGIHPDLYVMQEEGTYNWATNNFWCTECYIKIGMPLGKA